MAADIQQLLLQIDASTELMRRELARGDDALDKTTRKAEEAAGGIEGSFKRLGVAGDLAKGAIVGFVASLSVDAVVGFGKAILDTADDIATAAEQSGIAVERYQTLKELLRALEIDADKVDRIFGILNDTLGAVQAGTAAGGAAAALDKMGITTRILNGEIDTTDELLDAIAASAKNFGSEAEFTAAVVDIVGRKVGVELAAALKDGGAALKAGEDAFRSAGGVIDEEYIAKLADANEAVDAFVSRSKSALVIWAGETLIAFEKVGNYLRGFTSIVDQAISGGGSAASGIAEALSGGAGNVSARGQTLNFIDSLPVFSNGGPPASTGAGAGTIRRAPAGGGGARRTTAARAASLTPAQQRLFANDTNAGFGFENASPIDISGLTAGLEEARAIAVDLSNVEIINPEQIAAISEFGDKLSKNCASDCVWAGHRRRAG